MPHVKTNCLGQTVERIEEREREREREREICVHIAFLREREK